jgi:hypothetical protein
MGSPIAKRICQVGMIIEPAIYKSLLSNPIIASTLSLCRGCASASQWIILLLAMHHQPALDHWAGTIIIQPLNIDTGVLSKGLRKPS